MKNDLVSILKGVKEHIAYEMADTAMINKMLELTFEWLETSAKEVRFQEILALSLAGSYLVKMYPGNYTEKFLRGFVGLLTCERLGKCSNLSDHFLDLSSTFQEIRVKAEAVQDANEGVDQSVLGAISSPAPPRQTAVKPGAAADGQEQTEEEVTKDAQAMLKTLEPLFFILSGLPDSCLGELGMSEKELLFLKMNVGSAALAIKAYNPASPGGRRAAFVGPESVGKSTLINYLTSHGKGTEFMYTAEAYATSTCCFISHGPRETLQKGPGQPVGACKVHDELKTISTSGSPGYDGSFDMLRATKPFHPPGDVNLIDVPGIRKDKQLETALALNLATTLVLCTGSLNSLQTQLNPRGGGMPHGLSLIPQLVEKIEPPLHVHCVITRFVKLVDFQKSREGYIKALKQYFPRSKLTIQFGNFKDMNDAQKGEAISDFYAAANSVPEKTSNLYEIFGRLESDVHIFTRKLSQVLISKDLKSYLSGFKIMLANTVLPRITEIITDSCKQGADVVKEVLEQNPVGVALDRILVNEMPVTRMVINDTHLFAIRNRVLINQELLFETRLCLTDWLKELGVEVHTRTMGEIVHNVATHCCPKTRGDTDQKFRMRWTCDVVNKVIGAIANAKPLNLSASEEEEGSNEAQMKHWEAIGSNHLGSYIKHDAFPWVLTGFYLISCDEFIQHKFLKGFRLAEEVDSMGHEFRTWTNQAKGTFDDIPYENWYDELCNLKVMSDVHNKIFEFITSAAKTFEDHVKKMSLLQNTSVPLMLLLKLSYALVQRIFIVMTPDMKKLMFTSFGEHMKSSSTHSNRLRDLHKDITDGVHNQQHQMVMESCYEAMDVMTAQGADRVPSLKAHMETMQEELAAMSATVYQLGSGYNKAGGGVMLVTGRAVGYTSSPAPSFFGNSPSVLSPLEKALRDLAAGKHQVHEPDMHSEDYKVYADTTLRSIQHKGSKVMVLVRREGEFSPSPKDFEEAVLREVSKEPRLSKCIVLWTPPEEAIEFTEQKYGEEWLALTSGMDIGLQALRTEQDVKDFHRKLDVALSDSDVWVDHRVSELVVDFEKRARTFSELILTFQAKKEGIESHRADILQQMLAAGKENKETKVNKDERVGTIKQCFKDSMKAFRQSKPDNPKFEKLKWPSAEFLKRCPAFLQSAVDEKDDKAVSTINELECRAFVYRVLLGQTVSKAEELAGRAFDAVVTPVLDAVADFLCLPPATLQTELERFCQSGNKEATHSEPTLYNFLRKDRFAAMYVGCVLSEVVPMLYCVMLPMLLDGQEPSKKFYKDHISQARKNAKNRGPGP